MYCRMLSGISGLCSSDAGGELSPQPFLGQDAQKCPDIVDVLAASRQGRDNMVVKQCSTGNLDFVCLMQ